MKNITVTDIKKNNLSQIYKLIYLSGKISKQEIATQLNLSLPTVTQKIVKLEAQELIRKDGHFQSSVGRRAVAYTTNSKARIAIGVGIFQKQIRILCVDLRGNIGGSVDHEMVFKDEDGYYKEVAYRVKDFILEGNYLSDQILGIAFAVQGLTSVDNTSIIYGKTLGHTGLDISVFSRYLNYSCSFFHDAKCAANTEIWFNGDLKNALYLSVGNHLGGAMIINGQILMGDNGHCGAAEHMQLVPNGRKCYCGKYGCIEAYCSLNALLLGNERIDAFFEALREGSPEHSDRWNKYLKTLAGAISNLHIILDRKIIIGGELAHHLMDEDLEKLKVLSVSDSPFADDDHFIKISHYPQDSVTVGACLYYIQDFINQI